MEFGSGGGGGWDMFRGDGFGNVYVNTLYGSILSPYLVFLFS